MTITTTSKYNVSILKDGEIIHTAQLKSGKFLTLELIVTLLKELKPEHQWTIATLEVKSLPLPPEVQRAEMIEKLFKDHKKLEQLEKRMGIKE